MAAIADLDIRAASTESLCREAAQKLMQEYQNCIHPASLGLVQTHELRVPPGTGQKAVEPQRSCSKEDAMVSVESPLPPCEHPPSYNEIANTSVQIPIHRGDGVSSFNLPPPPPPSPGDALSNTPRHVYMHATASGDAVQFHPNPASVAPTYPPPLAMDYPYGIPLPMVIGPGHSAYTIVPGPSAVVATQPSQTTAPTRQPAASTVTTPTTKVNQNSSNVITQNANNVNVVVENNINLGGGYPTYMCFSVTLCIVCCILDPTALVCVIPALICSFVACCSDNNNTTRHTGSCSLCCNITALVYGIIGFFVLIIPALIICLLAFAFAMIHANV